MDLGEAMEKGKEERRMVANLRAFKQPVHVGVLCPPNSAVTMLLNTMGEHGGMFVLMTQIPIQVSNLAKANGQANIALYPMLVFAIQKDEFEGWLSCKYDAGMLYQMEDVLNGKVVERG